MPAYKDHDRNTWYCSFYYKDWTGSKRIKKKRGFSTKREALAWERSFLEVQQGDLSMRFEDLWKLYINDMKIRLRENTINTKSNIVELKILPYFKDKQVSEIKPNDIRMWQNELIVQGYRDTYLKTINSQLSAILNYAVRYYDLKANPSSKAGTIGKGKADEMKFWTKDEFSTFIKGVSDKTTLLFSFHDTILDWY